MNLTVIITGILYLSFLDFYGSNELQLKNWLYYVHIAVQINNYN